MSKKSKALKVRSFATIDGIRYAVTTTERGVSTVWTDGKVIRKFFTPALVKDKALTKAQWTDAATFVANSILKQVANGKVDARHLRTLMGDTHLVKSNKKAVAA